MPERSNRVAAALGAGALGSGAAMLALAQGAEVLSLLLLVGSLVLAGWIYENWGQ